MVPESSWLTGLVTRGQRWDLETVNVYTIFGCLPALLKQSPLPMLHRHKRSENRSENITAMPDSLRYKVLSEKVNRTIKAIAYLSIPTIVAGLSIPVLATATPPSGRVAIMNAHSRLCLSPAGGGSDRNAQIVQFTCDQDPSRFWSFTIVNGDIVEITNVNSGLCLTVAGGNTERNTVSVQYTCDSDPSRRWRYTVVDPRRFRLVNVHSGLCLTVAGGGSDRNTTAVQYPCDGDPSRDWQIRSGR
jgi:ricin-type beta-trefoil lectin protein